MKIAIVGIGCRYPGANSADEFIENVMAGRRYFRAMPPERLPSDDYYHHDPSHPDTTYCKIAAVLEGFQFNPVDFKIPQSTFRATDTAQWLALQVASDALQDADLKQIDTARTAVILGNSLTGEISRAQVMRYRWPYVGRVINELLDQFGVQGEARAAMLVQLEERYKEPFAPVDEDSLAGGLSNTIPGRICNYFDFRGGGYTVDGACSSSLLSVIHACNGLENGDFDVALAGGVDISLDPFELVGFAKIGALSPGDIKVYDQRSSGFLPGEGCGIVVLKRLDDALADNDRIYATIPGWGASTDGKGGLTAPSVSGQMLALQRAYEKAGYHLGNVELIEGHGTGTPVGDKVELGAVAQSLLRDAGPGHRCGIGSIKSNIGHTKAAAGVAGLIKAAMSVYHAVLPPTQGLQVPNAIFASSASLYPLTRGGHWDTAQVRRAGVSSAGFGGINTHVTLEEVAGNPGARSSLLPLLHSAQDSEVFFIGADSHAAMLALVHSLKDAAARIAQAQLVDLAAHCAKLAGSKPVRLGIVADTPATLLARLIAAEAALVSADGGAPPAAPAESVYFSSSGARPRIAFVFPGQGSQRLNAGEQWRGRFGFIDQLWREFDATLASALPKPLSAHVFRDAHRESPETQRAMAAELAETAVAQPAIVAGSIASAELLKYFGIEPDLCLGHSLGEYSALWCAGALPAARTIELVARRGAAMTGGADGAARGAMLSVAAAPEQIAALLAQAGGYLTVANFNAPRQTVVSGDAEAIADLRHLCQAASIDSTVLPVSNAFHSRYMDQAQHTMLGHLEQTELAPLKRLLISSTSGELVGGPQDLRATLGGQITAPVQFVRAVETALAEDCDVFVEVGPGSIASRLTRHIVGERKARVFATDSANPETTTAELNQLLAFSFASGLPLRTGRVFEGRHTKPISLPYQASFITSPCELPVTPLQLDGVSGIELAGAAVGVSATAAAPRAKSAPAAAMAWTADTVLPMMQQYIVSKFGYPIEMVHAGAFLQEDLSLDSIKSVEVVSEGMARLGVAGDPTTLVTLNLAQIAQRLSLAKTELDAGTAPALPTRHDMPDWTRTFEIALQPQPISAGVAGVAQRYALVDGGDAALAQAVRAQLEAAGHTVAALSLPLTAGAFDGASGCLLVLGNDAAGTANQAANDGAVLAAGDPFATPMLLLDSAQAFLKQLKSIAHASPVFAVLTSGNGSLGRQAESAYRVDQLAAAGFVKTLSLENPTLRARYIELHRDIAGATAAALVAAELDADTPFAEVAYPDAATRLQPQLRLRTMASLPPRAQPAFEAGDVLVISGGAGGITAECALDIAATYGLRLALLGSTALADAAQRKPSLLANLQRFGDAGIVFQYYQCDLTDAGQVRAVMARVAEELGPVSALMHAAGLNRAHRIDKLAPSDFLAVMKPKILGLQNLLAAVDLERIKTIIAFSSIIAKSGMAGNADYSYANEWMNGVLNRIRTLHPQVRCLSYNFSVWAEVGMGVDSVAHLGKLGIDPIPLRDGVLHASALLEREWPAADLIVSSRLGGLATVRFETPQLPAQRFLETIVIHQPGVELVAEAMLKPELDHYLTDHNYQGSLLFPAVLGMEAMVQAACACVGETPASVLVALENVQFHKPIVVPDEGRAIRVYAQVLADRADEAGVRLRVAIRSSVTNYESDYFVAECVLSAAEFPEQVNDALWPAPLSVDPHDFLYGSVFFQGPMFQNISSFHSLSSRHCMVKVDPPAGTLVFDPASGHGTIFGSPEVRDCYLHAVQACVPQHRILPVGIERIVTRAAGGQLYMSAKERYHVDNEYCYDLEVFDADGYLVEVLQGFRCRILEAYTDTVALEKIAGIHQEAADRARLHEQEGEPA